MSFILDALRKSEKKRHNQNSVGVRAVYESPAPKPQKTRWWVIVLVLVLLINLMLVLWMTSFRQSVPVEPSITNSPMPSPIDSPASTAVAPETKAAEPAPAAAPEQPDLTTEVATESESGPIEPEVESQPAPPEIISTTGQTEPTDEPVAGNKLYSISELPSSLRTRISALKVSLHAYNANNPAASMVQIDGRLLRAGGQVDDDLTIEEITADGVILSSGEYRFLLSRRGQ